MKTTTVSACMTKKTCLDKPEACDLKKSDFVVSMSVTCEFKTYEEIGHRVPPHSSIRLYSYFYVDAKLLLDDKIKFL